MTFVPPPFAKDAVLEAAYAGCELIVCITEGIPAKDEAEMYDLLKEKTSSRLTWSQLSRINFPRKI